jgi:hypothetical protein
LATKRWQQHEIADALRAIEAFEQSPKTGEAGFSLSRELAGSISTRFAVIQEPTKISLGDFDGFDQLQPFFGRFDVKLSFS